VCREFIEHRHHDPRPAADAATRHITDPMLLEALRQGRITLAPEPDIKHPGLKCRMQRFVAGVEVAVVVYVEHPAPDLVVITVIDVKKD
jgi:hypothetical protein